MSDIAVEDHYLEYSSMKYFRDAAENTSSAPTGPSTPRPSAPALTSRCRTW